MLNAQGANRVSSLVGQLLDRGYERAAERTLRAISSSVTSGIMAQRLAELDAEAARLAETGERLRPDNPVLRAVLADLETVLRRNGARIDAAAEDLQSQGVESAATLTRQLALPGLNNAQLAQIGVRWNVPDPEAVNALVGYVESPAWAAEIARYPNVVLTTVNNQAIRGIVEGWNPLRTAREIRRMAENVPLAQANTLMRTVQLTSYRDASAIQQRANADILVEQIRIAALDTRTCLACVALHGTRLPVGERVNDHHNGRCTSIAVVRGVPRNVQTGVEWWNSLPPETRREMAGDAAFELLQSGRAQLRDFVQSYHDPVFGQMVREGSVSGIVGR